MTLLQSIILGIVQGLTEFFPVSSSAHLRLAKWLMGIAETEQFLYFDLICHSGTLLALILFLRKELYAALSDRRAIALFATALCPLVPAYFLLKPLRVAASDPSYLGYFLLFTSLLLFVASRKPEVKDQESTIYRNNMKNREVDQEVPQDLCLERAAIAHCQGASENKNSEGLPTQPRGSPKTHRFWGGAQSKTDSSGCSGIKVKDVLCIGIMQAMALVPGISRSGSTIAAGRLLGWRWVSAAQFSFLLAIPAILGGQALETVKLLNGAKESFSAISIGCYAAALSTSFAIGMIGVRFMFKIYEKGTVRPFAWYCLCAGIFSLWALHG